MIRTQDHFSTSISTHTLPSHGNMFYWLEKN